MDKMQYLETIRLKATKDQRIRVGSEKKNVKAGEIIEVLKSELPFYKQYGFMEIKMEDNIKEIKTKPKKKKPLKSKK